MPNPTQTREWVIFALLLIVVVLAAWACDDDAQSDVDGDGYSCVEASADALCFVNAPAGTEGTKCMNGRLYFCRPTQPEAPSCVSVCDCSPMECGGGCRDVEQAGEAECEFQSDGDAPVDGDDPDGDDPDGDTPDGDDPDGDMADGDFDDVPDGDVADGDGEEEESENCLSAIALSCGDSLAHSTVTDGRADYWRAYSCTARMMSGRETLYTFTSTEARSVSLQLSGLSVDLDLLLLTACDAFSCTEARGTPFDIQDGEELNFEAAAGVTYIVVVDGYGDAAGSYTLDVVCDANADGDGEGESQ